MSPGSASGPSRLAPASGNPRNRVPCILQTRAPARFRLSAADRRSVLEFAVLLNERVAGGRGFDCLLTSDDELTRLNREFLHHDYVTDVLSFPSGSSLGPLGDLAISLERTAAQANEFGHSILDEIRILLLHGVLHLTGMDHERDDGRMARIERKWRTEFDLPETLISRSSPPRPMPGGRAARSRR
jgi:probable rRNA maturation factor